MIYNMSRILILFKFLLQKNLITHNQPFNNELLSKNIAKPFYSKYHSFGTDLDAFLPSPILHVIIYQSVEQINELM